MTMLIDFYVENARAVNFILLIGVIAGLTATIIVRRQKATRRVRRIMMWIYLIFVNFAYGTADNLHDHIRINPPVIVSTLLLVGLLGSILWTPPGDDERPPHDGAFGTRFTIWLDNKVVRYKTRHGKELT